MTAAAGRLMRDRFADAVDEALAGSPPDHRSSAAIALLYVAQACYGHLSAEAVEEVAEIIGVDPTRVRALVGFYTLLRTEPSGRWVIQVCTDLPCALRGSEALLARLCQRLGVSVGGTTADGLFTVEEVMCLAACHRAPVAQVNLSYVYDLDADGLEAVLEDLRRRAAEGLEWRPPLGAGPAAAGEPCCPEAADG